MIVMREIEAYTDIVTVNHSIVYSDHSTFIKQTKKKQKNSLKN